MQSTFVAAALFYAPSAMAEDVQVGINVQTRYVEQVTFDPAEGATTTDGSGFRSRRAAVTGKSEFGDAFELRFKIDLARTVSFVDADGESRDVLRPILDDSALVLGTKSPVTVTLGQYKLPFSQQTLTPDNAVVFPERSLVVDGLKVPGISVSGLAVARDIGAMVQGKFGKEKVGVWAGVFGGDGPNVWPPKDPGNLYVVRVAASPMGKVAMDEADLAHGDRRIAFGAAVLANHSVADATVDGRFEADLRYFSNGFGLIAEGEMATSLGGEAVDPAYGFHATANYALASKHLLPAARFSLLRADDTSTWTAEGAVAWLLPNIATPEEGDDFGHKGKLILAWQLAGSADEGPVGTQVLLEANVTR